MQSAFLHVRPAGARNANTPVLHKQEVRTESAASAAEAFSELTRAQSLELAAANESPGHTKISAA